MRIAYPLACVSVIAVLLVMYLSQYAQLVTLQNHMTQLEVTRNAQLQQRRDLLVEVQKFSSLSRIERQATQRLGMVPTAPRTSLVLYQSGFKQASMKTAVAVKPALSP